MRKILMALLLSAAVLGSCGCTRDRCDCDDQGNCTCSPDTCQCPNCGTKAK